MAPPLTPIDPASLRDRIQINEKGRLKKHAVELSDCKLQVLKQYNCYVDNDEGSPHKGMVVCEDLLRLFRKCKDDLTVETTAWPDEAARIKELT